MCLQGPEPSSNSRPKFWVDKKRFHGLGSVLAPDMEASWERLGDPTNHSSRALTLTSSPFPWLEPSLPGAACTRFIPWGKDKCPGVPQVAGEAPKISHQHLQPDGALPLPLGGQQGEGSHACGGAKAGCGEVGSYMNVLGGGCSCSQQSLVTCRVGSCLNPYGPCRPQPLISDVGLLSLAPSEN